jgi:beta-lactamase class A
MSMKIPTSLAGALAALSDAQPFRVAWHLKALGSGAVLARDGERPVVSRSTRKVAIMMTLLGAVARGELALDQPIVVPERFQHTRSGLTQFFLPNPVLRLADAMTLMIGVSDNGCTGAIMELLGLDRVNAFCRAAGMAQTLHRNTMPLQSAEPSANTVSTPGDQARLLQAILDGSTDAAVAHTLGCTPAHCTLALQTLKAQQLRGKIPALLPADAVVAHKDGTGPGLHHDTGIVYRAETPLYILCAYTCEVPVALPDGDAGAAAASRFIARLARTAWDALAA